MKLLLGLRARTPSSSSSRSLFKDDSSGGSSTTGRSSSSLMSTTSDQDVASLMLFSSLGSSASSRFYAASYSCLGTFTSSQGAVFSLCASENQLFSGSQDNQILVWERQPLQSGQFNMSQLYRFAKGGDGCVKALLQATSKGKALLFSAHQDNKIRVWRRQSEPSDALYKLSATLPTARDIARACMLPRNYVKVRRHRKCLWLQHNDTISSLAKSWDGSLLFSCSWDRTVKVWRISDLKCLDAFRAHDDAINALVVSPDGYLYTGAADSTIKVWTKCNENRKFMLVSTLRIGCERHRRSEANGAGSSVNALALDTFGYVLYSGMSDSRILVWNRKTPDVRGGGELVMKLVESLKGHKQAVLCLALTQELLCSGSGDGSVRMWRRDHVKGEHCCLGVLKGHSAPVKSVSAVAVEVDDEEFHIYSGGLDKRIIVWKVCLSPTFMR